MLVGIFYYFMIFCILNAAVEICLEGACKAFAGKGLACRKSGGYKFFQSARSDLSRGALLPLINQAFPNPYGYDAEPHNCLFRMQCEIANRVEYCRVFSLSKKCAKTLLFFNASIGKIFPNFAQNFYASNSFHFNAA